MPRLRQCKSPQCDKPVKARGFCIGHYARYRNGTDTDPPLRANVQGHVGCKIDGCMKEHTAKGFCRTHYYAQQRRERNPPPDPALLGPPEDPERAEWRPIPNFEGYYEVSEDGRVRSLPRRTLCVGGAKRQRYGQFIKNNLINGYPFVMLNKHGKQYNRRVHTLVAEAFIGPRAPGLTVHHKDHDKTNNHRSNLEYLTQKQNIRKAVQAGRFDRSAR